jgi:hypothetical protein
MKKPVRDPGRGQLHKRGARAWRDEENPTGPGMAQDESEPAAEATTSETPEGRDELEPDQPAVDKPVNAGPGGGGATESAPSDRQHDGTHGGPSRKS